MSFISENCSKISNVIQMEIDLRHTENIIQKFKFESKVIGLHDNFDDLLRVFFELLYIESNLIS